MKVKTRFAPSPTGFLHVGGLRTAVYAFALAKHNQGDFVLRIEDTDQKREVEGSVESLKSILRDFGLIWDEYYVQSERVESGVYRKAAEKMVNEGQAFYCQCEAKNVKEQGFSKELRDPCREKGLDSGAVKLKVPENEIVAYTDLVGNKEISWNTSSLADPTLLKSDGFPTYHLAVVVDDYDMQITHVLRGHDWMPSTPIHLLVYKYLGYEHPQIGHLTDILDPNGGKLSKRKGNVSVEDFINRGYLKEAILNFVLLMGWAPKDNQELFTLEEFVEAFDEAGFQVSNPTLNLVKLDWFNGQYIRKLSDAELIERAKNLFPELEEKILTAVIPLIKERIVTLREIESIARFIWKDVEGWDATLWKNLAKEHLTAASEVIEKSEIWTVEYVNQKLMTLISENQWKTGDFFMNLRVAMSGQKITPPITECIILMDKSNVLKRIIRATETISES